MSPIKYLIEKKRTKTIDGHEIDCRLLLTFFYLFSVVCDVRAKSVFVLVLIQRGILRTLFCTVGCLAKTFLFDYRHDFVCNCKSLCQSELSEITE